MFIFLVRTAVWLSPSAPRLHSYYQPICLFNPFDYSPSYYLLRVLYKPCAFQLIKTLQLCSRSREPLHLSLFSLVFGPSELKLRGIPFGPTIQLLQTCILYLRFFVVTIINNLRTFDSRYLMFLLLTPSIVEFGKSPYVERLPNCRQNWRCNASTNHHSENNVDLKVNVR